MQNFGNPFLKNYLFQQDSQIKYYQELQNFQRAQLFFQLQNSLLSSSNMSEKLPSTDQQSEPTVSPILKSSETS